MGAESLGYKWQLLRKECREKMSPICHLCGEYIDRDLPARHPMSWSLDHIIPLARGGARYDYSNLAPAHLSCNSRKGTREQRQTSVKTEVDW